MSKTTDCTLSDPFYEQVKSGEKKYEIRQFIGKWHDARAGDTLRVTRRDHPDQTFERRISAIRTYSTEDPLRDAIAELGIKKCLPHLDTVEEGVDLYLNPEGAIRWKPEDVHNNGVVALELMDEQNFRDMLISIVHSER